MPYEFRAGKRSTSQLLYSLSELQIYAVRNHYPTFSRYACTVKGCKGVVKLVGEVCSKVANFKEHNHGDQEDEFKMNGFITKLKADVQITGENLARVFNRNLMA